MPGLRHPHQRRRVAASRRPSRTPPADRPPRRPRPAPPATGRAGAAARRSGTSAPAARPGSAASAAGGARPWPRPMSRRKSRPATRHRPGRARWTHAATASRSCISPSPSSKTPSDAPTPRKLKRTVARPSSRSARSSMVTTLLCMVPPCSGCGWQTMATPARACSGAGGSVAASMRPAGPASTISALAAGKASGDFTAGVMGAAS